MSLHNEIMNIPKNEDTWYGEGTHTMDHIYALGHRDARHAAAEVSLKYERYIRLLEENLGDFDCTLDTANLISELRKEVGL